VLVARWLTGEEGTNWVIAGAAILAVIGHIFPVWLKFKAGKGVATGLGVFLALAPLAVATSAAVFIIIVALTRYISLGSILAAGSAPLWAWLWQRSDPDLRQVLVALAVSSIIIIVKHHENFRRLVSGTEHKFGKK
jgi:glycerol-3-phosphate acyltransferase PlsY